MNPYLFPPRNLLVPTDMGPVSKSALKYARFFHERFGSKVTVLHAEHLEFPPYFLGGQLGDLKPDLIVMGAERKKSKLGERFSSTTAGIMQIAARPLLVVPRSFQ
jgi:hypothetical protein